MTRAGTKYVVITPVRNEQAYLGSTIESMLSQTVPPAEWIIVNDGSTDSTGRIIDDLANRCPWVRAIHREDRGYRKSGGGVVEAFDDGYSAVLSRQWDFIVKLDGDLAFGPDYFDRCFQHFAREPELGVAGGIIEHIEHGRRCVENCPAFHVRGATKIYRRACWEAIGGFWPAPGWDTIDEVKAQMLGWRTRSLPDLRLLQLRHTGASDGMWSNAVKNGRANYVCGYHPLFMLGKCVRRLLRKPYLIGSLGLFWGFITGYLRCVSMVDDSQAITYLRKQQLARLTGRSTMWK